MEMVYFQALHLDSYINSTTGKLTWTEILQFQPASILSHILFLHQMVVLRLTHSEMITIDAEPEGGELKFDMLPTTDRIIFTCEMQTSNLQPLILISLTMTGLLFGGNIERYQL